MHNYLLFGASAKMAIEKESLVICDKTVTFKFKMFPNDMKMQSEMAGELNNAATYPTTFARITKGN